jgi:hypothetical protein
VTRKQIAEANKAREAVLAKDDDFRLHAKKMQTYVAPKIIAARR